MIINLTQHTATAEQVAAGVTDLPDTDRVQLINLLTVDDLPSRDEIVARCHDIAMLAVMAVEQHPVSAMIGGAPWMMSALENALIHKGIEPVYAFSKRESVEIPQPDGSVRKTNVFRHVGFV